jgi:O-antigen ligase
LFAAHITLLMRLHACLQSSRNWRPGVENHIGPTFIVLYVALPLAFESLQISRIHDTSRWLQLILLFAVGLSCLTKSINPPPPFLSAFALCWSFAACAVAALPSVAARELALLVGLTGFALAISTWPVAVHMRMVRWLCVIGLLYALLFFTTLATAAVLEGNILPFALVFGFDNPRHLAHTQTVLVPLALTLAAYPNPWRWRALGWITATLTVAVAATLTSRATLLSIALALFVIALALRASALHYLKLSLSSLLIGVCLGAGLLASLGVDVSGAARATGSWEARLQLWQAALDDAKQSPTGVGPMHFSRIQRGDAAHPHNAYLQTAAEFGFPAAIALVVAVIAGLTKLARRVRLCGQTEQKTWGVGLWVTCAAIAIDATLSGNLVMPVAQIWVFLAIGFALGWYREAGGMAPVYLSPRASLTVRSVCLAMLAALLGVSTWEFFQPVTHLTGSQWIHTPSPEVYSPRFWRNGWF